MSFLITDQAIASDGPATQWLTSKTQSALNRSTIALAQGRVKRGIHFAGVALNRELNDSDRFIAYHNLCIGHLALGKEDRSSYYCDVAFSLAQEGGFVVKSIRGAHFVAESSQVTEASTQTLSYVLTKNVFNMSNRSHLLGQL